MGDNEAAAPTMKFPRVAVAKGAAQWGTALATDINKALDGIDEHINKSIDNLKTSLKQTVTDAVVEAVNDLVTKIDSTKELAEKNEARVTYLEKKLESVISMNSDLKSHVEYLESKERRANLIFKGIAQDNDETMNNLILKVKNVMQHKMNIPGSDVKDMKITCFRIKGQKHNKADAVCVKFQDVKQRKLVWDSRASLVNVPEYYVTDDYAPSVQRQRRKLFQIWNVAQKIPEYKSASVNFNTLYYGGRKYNCDSLHLLPPPINPRHTCEQSTGDILLFGGPNSDAHPLCNWKMLTTPITYNGVSFPSSEHAYLFEKAKFAKDEVQCQNIRHAADAAGAKWYSHRIKGLDEAKWDQRKEGIMKDILRLKFKDKVMAEELLNTGDKRIHEAGRDMFWATGVSISHKDALKTDLWKGSSKLGKLLMDIRNELKNNV